MGAAPSYVELHLHTAFSFLDGASLPEELIGRAVELGYPALAVTDHNGLYGAMEFAQLAHAAGITPITGTEITLTDGTHLTLLAETAQGYANLCRLITAAHRETRPVVRPDWPPQTVEFRQRGIGTSAPRPATRLQAPALDPALLATHAAGVILLTGCRHGRLAGLVDAGRLDAAEAQLREYVAWFGHDRVVVELQQNLVVGDTHRIISLIQLADRLDLPYAATGNVHYHVRERHRLNDVLTAIRHRTTLDGCHRERRPNAEFCLRSAAETARLFARYPAALRTTLALAERCAGFNLATDLTYRFPDYPTPPGQDADALLADVCRRALAQRYPERREAAEARLGTELGVIAKHGLAGFFLLYRDLLVLAAEVAEEIRGPDSARARSHLPPGRGRGSSVSSIVCYLIGLSHVDPLQHDLFFGRFLNDELASVPDIDLDFPREIRERLIERVSEVYGPERAALVCAFSTYRLQSALRDVGKVLGIPAADLDRIAKVSEPRSAGDLGAELARLPAYATCLTEPPWSHLVELAAQLAGFPRHITQHSGGMIVSATPLCELVPLQPAAMAGRVICQWDKDACDDAKVVKIDFLALGMLSLVEECLELIAAGGEPPPDLSRIDLADPAVFDMICAGDTIGVFQIESRAQIQMLPRTRPRRLEDLIVQVAIIRPGPVIGGAVKPYVAHRERQRTSFLPLEPHYDHPLLEPVLAETHGVVLYQEQVLQVAMALAGFSAGQAAGLRRAMTRKRSREAMVRLWQQFRDGAAERGVDLATAQTVFRKLLGFASYGFPKAHAAAFAVLAYQSCWLKRYYPAAFLCALLNNQPMGFYPPHVLTNDAKRRGLPVRPPDVNRSGVRCTVEEDTGLRIGLGYVRGLGEATARQIVREREAAGAYRSLADLVRRVPLAGEAVEALVLVGAVDAFGLGRREALWLAGLFVPGHQFGGGTRERGRQPALPLPVAHDAVDLSPMTAWERMAHAYRLFGLSPHFHPLGLLRRKLPAGLATTADLTRLADGAVVRIAGLVVCRQRPETARGITFLLIEDEAGLANVIIPLALYERQRQVVRGESFVQVTARLQRRGGVINLLASAMTRLDVAALLADGVSDGTSDGTAADDRSTAAGLSHPAAHNYR